MNTTLSKVDILTDYYSDQKELVNNYLNDNFGFYNFGNSNIYNNFVSKMDSDFNKLYLNKSILRKDYKSFFVKKEKELDLIYKDYNILFFNKAIDTNNSFVIFNNF